jgi:hypothetical protein
MRLSEIRVPSNITTIHPATVRWKNPREIFRMSSCCIHAACCCSANEQNASTIDWFKKVRIDQLANKAHCRGGCIPRSESHMRSSYWHSSLCRERHGSSQHLSPRSRMVKFDSKLEYPAHASSEWIGYCRLLANFQVGRIFCRDSPFTVCQAILFYFTSTTIGTIF